MQEQTPQDRAQDSGGNENFDPRSEILSDEEMRNRAAAFAQQIYEQELESLRGQRERAIARQRALEEFEQKQAEYAQAYRNYCEQFYGTAAAVTVDPATGAQTAVPASAPDAITAAADVPVAPPPDDATAYYDEFSEAAPTNVAPAGTAEPDASGAVPADAENSESAAPYSVRVDPETGEQVFVYRSAADVPETVAVSAENAEPDSAGAEAAAPDEPEPAPSVAAAPKKRPAKRRASPFKGPNRIGGSEPIRIPSAPVETALVATYYIVSRLIVAVVIIFCILLLGFLAIVLFSNDPRYDSLRNAILSVAGANDEQPAPAAAAEAPAVPAEISAPAKIAAPEEPAVEEISPIPDDAPQTDYFSADFSSENSANVPDDYADEEADSDGSDSEEADSESDAFALPSDGNADDESESDGNDDE